MPGNIFLLYLDSLQSTNFYNCLDSIILYMNKISHYNSYIIDIKNLTTYGACPPRHVPGKLGSWRLWHIVLDREQDVEQTASGEIMSSPFTMLPLHPLVAYFFAR